MSWTERKRIAFPASMIIDANKLASIIDPDTAGEFTFTEDRVINDYIFAEIPFKEEFWRIVNSRNVDDWISTIVHLSKESNEELDESIIRSLCSSMLIGDEIPLDIIE